MLVYKTFLKITKKNIGIIISYFTMFLVIMLIISSIAIKDQYTDFQTQSLSIAISDKDNTVTSKGLTNYLSKHHDIISLRSYDSETIQDNLFYGKIEYYLEIPKGFEQDLLKNMDDNILYNAKQKNSANGYFVDQQIHSYLSTLSLYITGGYSKEEAIVATNSDFQNLPNAELLKSHNKNANTDKNGMYFFFQYVPYICLCILLLGMTPILLAFRQKDLAHRIHCSSFSFKNKSFQLSLGCASYSLFLWLLFIIAATIVYGTSSVFSLGGLLCSINCLTFIAIATSIALLLSTFALNKNALNMITNIIALSMSFLCGIFIPQWTLSKTALSFGKFLPAYWYIKNNNMIGGLVNESFRYSAYVKNISIQLIFVLAIFSLFLLLSKQKKQNQL